MKNNDSLKQIFMLVECGQSIGMGHIARSVSFYEAFESNGYSPVLLIDGTDECKTIVNNYIHHFYPWKSPDCDLDLIRVKNVFMDAITPDQNLCDKIRGYASKFIVIDDYCRRRYCNSLIIDWTPGITESGKHKKNSKDNVLLLDFKYSIVRKDFLSKNEQVERYRTIPTVTVIMGGSDIRNLSERIVQSISDLEIHINLILGPASCSDINTLSPNLTIYHALDAQQIKKVFSESDIVISAGGQTLFELMTLGIPAIAIQVVDNQSEDLAGMSKLGFLKYIFQWNDPMLTEKISSSVYSYLSIPAKDRLSKEFQDIQHYIGHGMPLIINKITEYLNGKD